MEHLLTLQNLHVSYHTPRGTVQAVRGVDLTLDSGEVLAVVGESGCGKSALLKAVMRLLPENASVTGKILVNDTDIAPYSEKQLQKLRGSLFSMVFQDPMTALNPSMTIGSQIAEAVLVHEPKISKDALRARVLELMELVEIDRPLDRMKLYPHNFSGGIRGRGARVNHTKRGTACRAFCFYSLISSTRCSMAVCRFIYTTFRRPSLSLHMAGWHLFPGAAASSIRFFQVFPSSFE